MGKSEGRKGHVTKCFHLEKDMVEIAEKLAKKYDMSLNAYIKSLILEDFLLSGDPEAIKYSVAYLARQAREKIKRKVFDFLRGTEDEISGNL